MVVTLATVDLPGSTSTTLYGPRQLEVAAAILFRDIRRGWPVLTGRSRGGLDYRLERVTASAIRMVVTDRYAYARYVAERWYPLERRLGPQQVRDALREAGMVPEDADRIPSEISNVTGSGTASRPITVRGVGGQAPSPPAPPAPPPIANPTDLAVAKSLKQIADREPNKPTAEKLVFGDGRTVSLKQLRQKAADLGVDYKGVGLSPTGRETVEGLLTYIEENYPELLDGFGDIVTTDAQGYRAAVAPGNLAGKLYQRMYLAKNTFGNNPYADVENTFFVWADEPVTQTQWYRLVNADDPLDPLSWDSVHRHDSVAPPSGYMAVEEVDQIRREAWDAEEVIRRRFRVGNDDRFGQRVRGQRQRLLRDLIHEMGHLLHHSRGVDAVNEAAVYARWRQQTGASDWSEWAKDVSRYAQKDVGEATAEALAVRELYGAEKLPVDARLWLEYLESRKVVEDYS